MFDDTLTVRRYPTVLDHGTPVPDVAVTPTTTVIAGCDAQPGATTEILDHRDVSRIAWTVFVPAGTDVLSTDLVTLNGGATLFAVSGEPARWGSGAGPLDHVVVYLEAWAG